MAKKMKTVIEGNETIYRVVPIEGTGARRQNVYNKKSEDRVYRGNTYQSYLRSLKKDGVGYKVLKGTVTWEVVEEQEGLERHPYVKPTIFALADIGENTPFNRYPACDKCGLFYYNRIHQVVK